MSTLDFIQVMQDMVLNPTFGTALALFVVALLNELIAVFPFAVFVAGQLLFLKASVSLGFFTKLLLFVAIPVGIGSAIGAIPVYILAYFGGKPAIQRLGRYIKISWEDVEKANRRFKGEWYDEIIFLLLRIIPILPSLPISIAAGILRMPFSSYFVLSVVGFVVRMMLTLLVIGMGMRSLSQM